MARASTLTLAWTLPAALAAAVISVATVAAQAPVPPRIWISEVSPAGRAEHEWFELANNGAEPITLEGWRIADEAGSDPLPAVSIPPGNAIVIAASDAPDFQPDALIHDGKIGAGLNDDGDRLALINPEGAEQDAVAWGRSGAPASARAPSSGATLQRTTPDAPLCLSLPNPGRIPTLRPHTIQITEIMPNPVAGPEWVELVNLDSTEVDLEGWTLGDQQSSTPLSGTIPANGRLVVADGALPAAEHETLIVPGIGNGLNNNRDSVVLTAPGCIPADSMSYGTAALPAPAPGSSIALQRRWLINTAPSPGADGITSALAAAPTAAPGRSGTTPASAPAADAPGINPWVVVSASLAALLAAVALRQWRVKPDDPEPQPADAPAMPPEDPGLDQPPLDQPDIRYDDPDQTELPLPSVADSGEADYLAHSSPGQRQRHPWDAPDQ